MHYGRRSFTIDGNDTIITKNPFYQDKIGQRGGLSPEDIHQLNIYYNCPGKTIPFIGVVTEYLFNTS